MMSKMKVLMAGSALGAAILAGPAAAAVTGTVAATSEYTFRGIDSENGAAIQGSLDWSDASGLYAGAWMSNANLAGGNELDLYGGYKFKLTESAEIDLGVIYYMFTEDEDEGAGVPFELDYPEIYAGVNIGGFSAKVYYTNDFFGVDGQALPVGQADGASTYVNLAYTHTIKEGLTLKGAIGSQSGDGADAFVGDSVTDYALTLTKALENGFSVSFAAVGTDLDLDGTENSRFVATGQPFEDNVKFVVTLAKGFEI
jgi:uncharacterized protein (TIGR02001 family)